MCRNCWQGRKYLFKHKNKVYFNNKFFFLLPQNSPKFFCCVNPDEELNFQYKVLSSLDIIDEKLNPTNKTTTDNRELYLGQLYSLETCKMYPFLLLQTKKKQ